MSQGPFLIFDKSTLQGLNPDESVWLDNFFETNITPLFFIESLADLEKEVCSGRSPEQVVGNLAYKTPDMNSRANVHHSTLLIGELRGADKIEMGNGIPIVSGGIPVTLGGHTGLIFKHGPEEEALQRWQRGEFLNIERQIAKFWRQALSNVDYDESYRSFRQWFARTGVPKTLVEVKALCDTLIDQPDQARALHLGLTLLDIPEHSRRDVLGRWQSIGKPAIHDFAPYFRYVLSVELFFYLAIAADLISRDRPSNKVDLAYLYYLPFCMVFASSDHLHARVVPLFLRPNQTFVEGASLKADLGRLDAHYSALPEETKKRGLFEFASYPPLDSLFLVTQLWDKHLASWRKRQGEPKPQLDKKLQDALLKLANRFKDEGVPLDPATPIALKDVQALTVEKKVHARKGKWNRLPPEVTPQEIHPASTQFLGLVESLRDLAKDPTVSDIEVIIVSFKLDDHGKKILSGGHYVAEERAFGIKDIGKEAQEALRVEFEARPVAKLMILWLRRSAGENGKLGILEFHPLAKGEAAPSAMPEHDDLEKGIISRYLRRKSA